MQGFSTMSPVFIAAALVVGLTACAEQPVDPAKEAAAKPEKGFEVTGSNLRVKDRRSAGVSDASPESVANGIKAPTSPAPGGVGN
jgi:hypothetical protein